MMMPGRSYTAGTGYRYGFNGKENDNEVKGEGNQQDYGFRIYDPRLGKFLSVDPLTKEYPMLTPYQFASNRPIDGIDLDGLEYFDSKKYFRSTSLYGLQKFEPVSSEYTLGHLWIKNEDIHKIILNHPRTGQQELDDPDVPEIEMVKKRSSSRRAQQRERNETRAANRNKSGDIVSGIVDLIKWGRETYYDIKYKKEIGYAAGSIGALNNADILVRTASNASSFPSKLKANEVVLLDLTHYVTDGTLPTGDLKYSILIETWGKLIYRNREKILDKSYNFQSEKQTLEIKTVRTTDGQSYDIQIIGTEGNNDPDLKKANELLKTPVPATSPVIKKRG